MFCVQCKNDKNSPYNRLVTETCGHVKCMECLVKETSGCSTCKAEGEVKKDLESKTPVKAPRESGYVNARKDTETAGYSTCEKESQEKKNLESKTEQKLGKAPRRSRYVNTRKGTDELGPFTECTVCGKKFRSRWQVGYHEHCNKTKEPYQCTVDQCGNTFMSFSHYQYHMRVHNEDKSFVCDFCQTGFYTKNHLKRHMLTHIKDRNYVCLECKKTFNNASSLKQHMLIHSNDFLYQCEYCDKQIRDRSYYYRHVASCGGIDPNNKSKFKPQRRYKCPFCPISFKYRKNTLRHTAVHLDSKSYYCKICTNKQFRRKDSLYRHMRSYHPNDNCFDGETNPDANYERIKLAQTTMKQIREADLDNDKNEDLGQEKKILEKLNPLPPLSQDIIKEHLGESVVVPAPTPNVSLTINNIELDKSYIIEANTARESVIVAQNLEKHRKVNDDSVGYVHKIRKANNSLANRKTTYSEELKLPPIDETKISQLETIKNIDVGSPPRNTSVYKKILADESIKSAGQNHWKRKLKLNIQDGNT